MTTLVPGSANSATSSSATWKGGENYELNETFIYSEHISTALKQRILDKLLEPLDISSSFSNQKQKKTTLEGKIKNQKTSKKKKIRSW